MGKCLCQSLSVTLNLANYSGQQQPGNSGAPLSRSVSGGGNKRNTSRCLSKLVNDWEKASTSGGGGGAPSGPRSRAVSSGPSIPGAKAGASLLKKAISEWEKSSKR